MSLNEEQQAHMIALSKSPDKVCGCGWNFKAECRIYCINDSKQLQEEAEFRKERNFIIERCAKLADEWGRKNYPLKDIPEYKYSNKYRSEQRFAAETIAEAIRNLIK